MKTAFELKDVHDFLLEIGCPEWNYEVYDKVTGEKRKATIEDFDYTGRYSTTELAFVDKHGNDCDLTVYVSDFQFITYRDEPNVMGSGSTTYLHKDFTNAWIDYMLKVHGKEYASKLLSYSQKQRKNIEDELYEKVEVYKKKIYGERKDLEQYHQLSLKAYNFLTNSDVVDTTETI